MYHVSWKIVFCGVYVKMFLFPQFFYIIMYTCIFISSDYFIFSSKEIYGENETSVCHVPRHILDVQDTCLHYQIEHVESYV